MAEIIYKNPRKILKNFKEICRDHTIYQLNIDNPFKMKIHKFHALYLVNESNFN